MGTTTLLSGCESSGKTFTAQKIIAGYHALYPGKSCLYLNAENKIDPVFARAIGVDNARVEVVFPESTEEGQYLVRSTMENRTDVGLIVVDSLASLSPEDEVHADPAKEFVAIGARMNNRFFRQLTALQCHLVGKNLPMTMIIINQEREKTGLFGGTVLPGGKAQRFHAALWVKFLKSEDILHPKLQIPVKKRIRFVLAKNHGGATGWPGEFYLHTTPHGNFRVGDVEDTGFTYKWAAQRLGVLKKAGQKGFEFNGETHTAGEWLQVWQNNKPLYNDLKKILGRQFNDWLDSKLQEFGEDEDLPQEVLGDPAMADGGAFLGETLAGADPAGVGE